MAKIKTAFLEGVKFLLRTGSELFYLRDVSEEPCRLGYFFNKLIISELFTFYLF